MVTVAMSAMMRNNPTGKTLLKATMSMVATMSDQCAVSGS